MKIDAEVFLAELDYLIETYDVPGDALIVATQYGLRKARELAEDLMETRGLTSPPREHRTPWSPPAKKFASTQPATVTSARLTATPTVTDSCRGCTTRSR